MTAFTRPRTVFSRYQRLFTAAGLLLLLIAGLYCQGWFLRALILAAALLALYEFLNMYWPGRLFPGRKALGLALAVLIILAPARNSLWLLGSLGASFWAVALYFLFAFGRKNGGDTRFGHFFPLLAGLVYIPLALKMALHLNVAEQALVLGMTILADTGGWLAGSRFGRHKIWPVVSPGKSWEGSAGGLVLCLLFAGLVFYLQTETILTQVNILPALPLWGWLLLGLALNAAAQLGDFFESAIKRTLNVKDSGAVLPGHGGMLDRIDSLLFALPVYLLIRAALPWEMTTGMILGLWPQTPFNSLPETALVLARTCLGSA